MQQPLQKSPQYVHPHLQRPYSPQNLNHPQNNLYPIYPVQKVVFQAQPEASRLKKSTKIKPTITFTQQKSENQAYLNSEMVHRQSLPAYV